MSSEEEKVKLDFVFECEQCTESWSENLLDLIDRCTKEELLWLLKHIQNQVEKK
ncbi:MAG: hypothetical protein KAW51_07935 [Candidatus Lokiarchaeota archaeon]|nr:hypothetical protein [Candidatus Lokiarchaeota archaeon]